MTAAQYCREILLLNNARLKQRSESQFAGMEQRQGRVLAPAQITLFKIDIRLTFPTSLENVQRASIKRVGAATLNEPGYRNGANSCVHAPLFFALHIPGQ